jgi:hypothetical protein
LEQDKSFGPRGQGKGINMAFDKSSRIEEETLQDREATPKTPTLKENIVLSVKLLIGGAALILLVWYLDSHLSR